MSSVITWCRNPAYRCRCGDGANRDEKRVDQNSGTPLAVKGAFVVETDDLSQRGADANTKYPDDHVHLSTAGTLEPGRRIGVKMLAEAHASK